MIKNLFIFALLIASTASQRVKFSQVLIDPAIEGKTYPITVSLDEPIICTGLDTVDIATECRVTLIFDNPAASTLSISPCFLEWTTRDWYVTKTLQVRMIGHFRNVADKDIKLTPRPVLSKSAYYSEFVPSPIIVRFRSLNTATCSSTGDPHYMTFDNYYFHFYGRGKSWLAYVPGELEVQTITQGSGYSRNCAIAISEGGNYVALSVCTGNGNIQPLTIFKDTSATPKVLAYSGTNYQVDYPSGLTVKFQSWGNNANVYLTLPGRYYKHPQLSGLCGNWNGVATDEGIASYVMWEWSNLSPNHQIVSGSDVDLFSNVNDAKVMRTYNTADQLFLTSVKATCDYVPPVYVRPILNNPDVEDITELIKILMIIDVKKDTNFVITDEPIVNPDIDDTTVAPIVQTGPTLTELIAMCNAIMQRSELVNCQALVPRHVTNCINDLNLVQSIMVVQESLESARTECLQQQLVKTTTDEQANIIVNTICMANCPIYSKCVDNQCVCTNTTLKGPQCSIPINAIPEFNDIRPRLVDIQHWISYGASQIMFNMATRYIMPDDKLECVVNGVTYPANYLSETSVFCRLPLDVFVNSSLADFSMANVTVYMKVNDIQLSKTQYVASYNNPCILCDPNGMMECTHRTNQTCFPRGFKRFIPWVHGLSLADQSCEIPRVPCQYCVNDTTRVNWFDDSSCLPSFMDKNIDVRRVEESGIKLESVNLSIYINRMMDSNNNMWVDSIFARNTPHWRIRTPSSNMSHELICADIFGACMFNPSVNLGLITETVEFTMFMDLMIDNSVIDTLRYNLIVINNKDNDPTTTTTTQSTTTQSTTTQSTTTQSTESSSQTTTQSTTSTFQTTTSTLSTTLKTTTTPRKTTTPEDESPDDDYYTEPPTEITFTPFKSTRIPSTTLLYIPDKPVRVEGSTQDSASFPNYAFGIICGFVVLIMIIIALLYRRRYREKLIQEEKNDQQFIMDYKTMEDKNLHFINPIFAKPEYMEVNPGLINPLYDALVNMREGTYKVISTGDDSEHILAVRGTNGVVESYPIHHRENKVILNSIYDTNVSLEFDSIESIVNHYSTDDDHYPLSCKLQYVCPDDTYSSGAVYGYNNDNIKNTPIEPDEC